MELIGEMEREPPRFCSAALFFQCINRDTQPWTWLHRAHCPRAVRRLVHRCRTGMVDPIYLVFMCFYLVFMCSGGVSRGS
jgi:hypothetical protein